MRSLFALTMLFSLALSFFLSGMEAGVFALSRFRIRQRDGQNRIRAQLRLRFCSIQIEHDAIHRQLIERIDAS